MNLKTLDEKSLPKFLAIRPVASTIIALGKLRPYSKGHIWNNSRGQGSLTPGEGFDLYMGRYAIIDNPDGLHIRLHHIVRPDHDRDLHNHPFEYRTFVIRGWYDEVYLDAKGVERTRRIKAGQTSYSSGTFHRIAAVSPGGAWTIFVMGKDLGRWGFRVPIPGARSARWPYRQRYEFVPSKEYFARRDEAAQG